MEGFVSFNGDPGGDDNGKNNIILVQLLPSQAGFQNTAKDVSPHVREIRHNGIFPDVPFMVLNKHDVQSFEPEHYDSKTDC